MNDEEILKRLQKVFNAFNDKHFALQLDSKLVTELGLDSVGMLYMMILIEKEFNIDLSECDLSKLKTVSDVVNCIKEQKC